MQISDIHRSEADPISNDELLSCILTDLDRASKERPQISKPDAIVVCGDLVQGLPLASSAYPDELERQYDVALDLLIKLTDNVLSGDRSKVIIIPGNHDVDWHIALNAMISIDPEPNIPKLLSLQNSPYRWSWEQRQLFLINDLTTYDNRFMYFCKLFNTFYKEVSLAFSLDPRRPWNLFELDKGKIVVCAFNSCTNNDCFGFSGEISQKALSESHLELETRYKNRLLNIAVWHHHVEGPPMRSDYMDINIVRIMIDKGYRLGLHGHQHISDATPYSQHASEKQTMALISTGSLCGGLDDLPHGFSRQYNIIEISDDYLGARVHVREMNSPGIFSSGRFAKFGNSSFYDINWTKTPSLSIVNTGRGGGSINILVEEIECKLKLGQFKEAITQIDASGNILGKYGRQLLSEALFKSSEWERLIGHLSNPQDIDELMKLLKATVALKNWSIGEHTIQIAIKSNQYPARIIQELNKWFETERRQSNE